MTAMAGFAALVLALSACGGEASSDETPGGDSSPTGTGGVSEWGPAQAIVPVGVQATDSAPNSTDAEGNPTSYQPENTVDGDLETAWRIAGDGDGVQLVFDLGEVVRLTEIGLVPGYAKVDPVADIDRFEQNRRIETVVWDFADGASVTQVFDDEPTMQTVPVDVTTNWVRLTIHDTTEDGGRDFTAISEAEFTGRKAA
jgi:hypothetical protein